MSNMSYCRFRNTLPDFQECVDELLHGTPDDDQDPDEEYARQQIIELCQQVAAQFPAPPPPIDRQILSCMDAIIGRSEEQKRDLTEPEDKLVSQMSDYLHETR